MAPGCSFIHLLIHFLCLPSSYYVPHADSWTSVLAFKDFMGVLGKIDIPVKHYQVNNHTLIDV